MSFCSFISSTTFVTSISGLWKESPSMSTIFSFDSPKLLACLSMPSLVTLWCNFNHQSSLQQWRFIHLQQCNNMKHAYNLQGTSVKTFSLWSLDLLQIWMLGFSVQVGRLQLASLNPFKACQSFLRLGFNVQGFDHFQFSKFWSLQCNGVRVYCLGESWFMFIVHAHILM